MFNRDSYMASLVDICIHKNIEISPFAIISSKKSLSVIKINSHLKSPKILILGNLVQEDPAVAYGISRFLDKVPSEAYSHIGIDILPLVESPKIEIESKLLFRLLLNSLYNYYFIITEHDSNQVKIETGEKIKTQNLERQICSRILDTAGQLFPVDLVVNTIKIKRTTLENNNIEDCLCGRTRIPYIKVYIPNKNSFFEKVTCISRIIEDAINESSYNIFNPLPGICRKT